ncbi:Biofilm growth-associated repressor [Defluviimonas aquaemixtae]|uniref:Biofilm growth-associated repressor n=2 Tax=Albidovulum aquaemixtae TaxID=1542388 RepID=A0A2R8B1Y7_9RHOB|nr:Biofilm growth-associated repressor [Defluviimonas aquaemixtae]
MTFSPQEHAAKAVGADQGGGPLDGIDPTSMADKAEAASNMLKALAHDGRLMILCHLADGERSVTELETLLFSRQAAVSQQLARLRLEGLVKARREGKAIYYSLNDDRAASIVRLVYDIFCADD